MYTMVTRQQRDEEELSYYEQNIGGTHLGDDCSHRTPEIPVRQRKNNDPIEHGEGGATDIPTAGEPKGE